MSDKYKASYPNNEQYSPNDRINSMDAQQMGALSNANKSQEEQAHANQINAAASSGFGSQVDNHGSTLAPSGPTINPPKSDGSN